MAAERLQKYLARAGVASRRHAEELITSGRVGVNNQTVTELGSRVELGTDLVTVDGKLVTPPEESSYYLLYKPIGVVTTLSDPQGRPTVANYVEETGRRLFPVGRLDYDAEGALLFTDDGALAHKLTHPSFQVPRTYLAKVKGVPDMPTIEKLRGGVRLEDGMATPVYVGIFEKVERNTWLKIVVAEGRPHLIKRLCAAVGHPVVRLFRPAYAGVGVEGLRPGQLRQLKLSEVMQLNEVAEGRAQPAEAEMKLPPRRHGRAAPGFDGPDDDETELSMDDDAPMPPRKSAGKAERPDKRAAAGKAPTGPKTREARPERKDWKGVQDGGTRPPKFAVRGATLPTEDEDLDDAEVPTFDDDGEEVAEPKSEGRRGAGRAAEGETGGARGAGRAGRSEERAPRGAGGFGKPAGERAPRAGGFGKPAGERAPRAGGFGKPAGGSRFGGDEGRAPRAGGFGKPAGRGGDEGRAPRAGGFGKPAGRGGDEGRPPRAGGFGKPAGAGRFGGDERGAPRGRPAGASRFGGDEGGAPRGRPTGGSRFGGDEGAPRGRPAGGSRFGGDEGGAPRGRPTGGSRFGGDEGAPRGRPAGGSRFGGDEGRAPRAGGFGKPAGRGGDEGRPPRAGGFGKPAGRGGDEGRPPRAGGFGKPAGAGRFGRDEGRPPRAGGFGKPAGGSRFGSDEGRPPRAGGFGKPAGRFSRDEGRPPRAGGFGKPAGDRAPRAGGFGKPAGRFGRDEGRPPRAGGFGKPAGGSRFGGEGGARGGARFGKPAGGASRGEGRPERREWKPRGESAGGAGRPERREWKPRGEDGGSRGPPRERRGGVGRTPSTSRPGDSARPSGERIVRAGIRKGPPGEGGSKPPRGASDRSAPRGPRRPR